MIPLPPTIGESKVNNCHDFCTFVTHLCALTLRHFSVPGANNLPGGGPLSESALTKIIQDQHRAFMQQYTGGQANADGNNSTAEGNSGAGAPVGISFPLFPPDMTTEEIQEFMQDPDNQAKIKVPIHILIVVSIVACISAADLPVAAIFSFNRCAAVGSQTANVDMSFLALTIILFSFLANAGLCGTRAVSADGPKVRPAPEFPAAAARQRRSWSLLRS